eukprot:gene17324-49746_t
MGFIFRDVLPHLRLWDVRTYKETVAVELRDYVNMP